jgi:hypothetical protein
MQVKVRVRGAGQRCGSEVQVESNADVTCTLYLALHLSTTSPLTFDL